MATILASAPQQGITSFPPTSIESRIAIIGEVARSYATQARQLQASGTYHPGLRQGLVQDARLTLQARLDFAGWQAVHHFVTTHVKSRTRIFNDHR